MFDSEHIYIYIPFVLPRYTLHFHFHASVLTALDLKFVRFLREACPKLAQNWVEKLSLAGLLLIANLHLCFPTRGLERRNYMRQSMIQIQIKCRIATQTYKTSSKKQHEIPYYNFPCAKPWAGLARNFRDTSAMQVLSCPKILHKPAN